MLHLITQEDIEEAVDHLAEELPNKVLKETSQSIRNNSEVELFHFGFGTKVRNTLREGGFNWNDAVLDQTWRYLVKKAIQKKF